jgi:hypothetical protein
MLDTEKSKSESSLPHVQAVLTPGVIVAEASSKPDDTMLGSDVQKLLQR